MHMYDGLLVGCASPCFGSSSDPPIHIHLVSGLGYAGGGQIEHIVDWRARVYSAILMRHGGSRGWWSMELVGFKKHSHKK